MKASDNKGQARPLGRRDFIQRAGVIGAAAGCGGSPLLGSGGGGSAATASCRIGLLPGPRSLDGPQADFAGGLALGVAEVNAGESSCTQRPRPRLRVRLPENAGGRAGTGAARAAEALVASGVDVLVGLVSPLAVGPLRSRAVAAQVPLLANTTGGDVIDRRDLDPYLFFNSLQHAQAAFAAGAEAGRSVQGSALVVTSLLESGSDEVYAFRRGFESSGGGPVEVCVLPGGGGEPVDLAPAAEALRAGRPGAVFAHLLGLSGVAFRRAWPSLASGKPGDRPALFASAGLLAEAGSSAGALPALGFVPWVPGLDRPENLAFASSFERVHGRAVTAAALLGYEAAGLIASASGNARRGRGWAGALEGATFEGPRGRLAMDPEARATRGALYRIGGGGRAGGGGVEAAAPPPVFSPALEDLQGSLRTGWIHDLFPPAPDLPRGAGSV